LCNKKIFSTVKNFEIQLAGAWSVNRNSDNCNNQIVVDNKFLLLIIFHRMLFFHSKGLLYNQVTTENNGAPA
jgi:hypothetical protein